MSSIVQYSIRIFFTKKSVYSGHTHEVSNPMYPSKSDKFVFLSKRIDIIAERWRLYSFDDIFRKETNSLYLQLVKALLFHYAVNQNNGRISHIAIYRGRKKTVISDVKYNKYTHPLYGIVRSNISLNPHEMLTLFSDDKTGKTLRHIVSHWLRGRIVTDKYYSFERNWRAFEQLCSYHNQPAKEIFLALRQMREYLVSHNNTPTAQSIAKGISYTDFRGFRWIKLIHNNYPSGMSQKLAEAYRDYFVLKNTDERIIKMLNETLPVRFVDLKIRGVAGEIQAHINQYLKSPVVNDKEVLAILLCKYAYFVRNKIAHGETVDTTFRFMPSVSDDVLIDKLNNLLSITCAELLNVFSSL